MINVLNTSARVIWSAMIPTCHKVPISEWLSDIPEVDPAPDIISEPTARVAENRLRDVI